MTTQEPKPPDPAKRADHVHALFAAHGLTLQVEPEDFARLGAPVDPSHDAAFVAHLLVSSDKHWSRQLVTLLEARADALGRSRSDARHALKRARRALDGLERVRDPERFVGSLVLALDRLVRIGDGTRAARQIEARLCEQDWPQDVTAVVAKYAVLHIPLAALDHAGEPRLAVLAPLRAVAGHWSAPEDFARRQLPRLLGETTGEETVVALPQAVRVQMQDHELREWAIDCFARELQRRLQPACQAPIPATEAELLALLGLIARHATDSRLLEAYRHPTDQGDSYERLRDQLERLVQRRMRRDPTLRNAPKDVQRDACEDWVQDALTKLARAKTAWNGANSLLNYLVIVVDSTRPAPPKELRVSNEENKPAEPQPPACDPREIRNLVRHALRENALAAAIVNAAGLRADISDKQRERFAAKARGQSDQQIDPEAPGAVRRSLRLGREKIVRPFMQLLRTPPAGPGDREIHAQVRTIVDEAVEHVRTQSEFGPVDQACYGFHFGTQDQLRGAAKTRFDHVRKAIATPLRNALHERKLPGALLRAYDAIVGHSQPGRRSDDEHAGSDEAEIRALLRAHFELLPGSLMQTTLCELQRSFDREGFEPVAGAVQTVSSQLESRGARAVFDACFMLPLALCNAPREFPVEPEIEHHLPDLTQRVWRQLLRTQIDSAVLAAAEPFFGAVP